MQLCAAGQQTALLLEPPQCTRQHTTCCSKFLLPRKLHHHLHLSPTPPPPPLPPSHPVVAHPLQSADVLENVAAFALKTRLKESRLVKASVSCDTWSLLSGRVNGAKIYGEGWRSPLNLTAQILEVGACDGRGRGRGLGRGSRSHGGVR